MRSRFSRWETWGLCLLLVGSLGASAGWASPYDVDLSAGLESQSLRAELAARKDARQPTHRPHRRSRAVTRMWRGRGASYRVVVRLSRQRLYLLSGETCVAEYRIATGRGRATPSGIFYVARKQLQPDWHYRGRHVRGGVRANPLGVCWMGLTMPKTWRGAPIGLHGTNQPWLIGTPVSRGCIRLRNADAWRLYQRVAVGTPVFIRS